MLNCTYYHSFKLYEVTPSKPQIVELLNWEYQTGVDFWTKPVAGRASKIMLSPDVQEPFLNFLVRNQIEHKLSVDNVQSILHQEKEKRQHSRKKRSALSSGPNFDLFWSYEEMETFSIQLERQHPNLVKRDVIGKTIEGRDIFGMRVSSSSSHFGEKPIIFIDSGVHAREWVGPASTLYLLNQLVTNATVSAELLEKVDWVFVNNANPDGEFDPLKLGN